jgi:hypothetical protein
LATGRATLLLSASEFSKSRSEPVSARTDEPWSQPLPTKGYDIRPPSSATPVPSQPDWHPLVPGPSQAARTTEYIPGLKVAVFPWTGRLGRYPMGAWKSRASSRPTSSRLFRRVPVDSECVCCRGCSVNERVITVMGPGGGKTESRVNPDSKRTGAACLFVRRRVRSGRAMHDMSRPYAGRPAAAD